MTLASLHKIIQLEKDLLSNEKAEQEKAELWITEQQEAILNEHSEKLSLLEKKIEEKKRRAAQEARHRADKIINVAEKKALRLKSLDNFKLKRLLQKYYTSIIGKAT